MKLLKRLVEALERIATALEDPINRRIIKSHLAAHISNSEMNKADYLNTPALKETLVKRDAAIKKGMKNGKA